MSLSEEEFFAALRNEFPRVGSVEFELARVDGQKKIRRIQVCPLSPSVLKATRVLKRSALYMLPKVLNRAQALIDPLVFLVSFSFCKLGYFQTQHIINDKFCLGNL